MLAWVIAKRLWLTCPGFGAGVRNGLLGCVGCMTVFVLFLNYLCCDYV